MAKISRKRLCRKLPDKILAKRRRRALPKVYIVDNNLFINLYSRNPKMTTLFIYYHQTIILNLTQHNLDEILQEILIFITSLTYYLN